MRQESAGLPGSTSIRARVAAVLAVALNSCLVNLYRDGSDSTGWHSDEPELSPQSTIASLSLGAAAVHVPASGTRRRRAYLVGPR